MKPFSLIEKAFFIKKTELFKDLDIDLLVAIADKMHQDIYDAKEKVFDYNQRASKMYFIGKGSVELFDRKKNLLCTLKKKAFFGDEALFHEKERECLALCKEPSLILTITKTHLLSIISECPTVAISFLEKYAKKINELT